VHCRESGVCDHYAENDTHALAIARRIVTRLQGGGAGAPPQTPADPRHDPAELYGVLPANLRKPYDVREVNRAARGRTPSSMSSSSSTARPWYAGLAHLCAIPVGILATTACCSPRVRSRDAFHRLCSREQIPLLFLQNITGFMVGRRAEAGGIAKDGAKLVTAVGLRRRGRS